MAALSLMKPGDAYSYDGMYFMVLDKGMNGAATLSSFDIEKYELYQDRCAAFPIPFKEFTRAFENRAGTARWRKEHGL